jgi:hypothetical protein
MAKPKNRGQRPQPAQGRFPEPAAPPNYDDESPKFCLNFLRNGFDVHALDAAGQKWKDLITAHRHKQGTELIPASQIKAPIPPQFQDEPKFMVLRYDGKLPMVGVRVRDVFHVLWIEPEFGRLYKHS